MQSMNMQNELSGQFERKTLEKIVRKRCAQINKKECEPKAITASNFVLTHGARVHLMLTRSKSLRFETDLFVKDIAFA